MVGKVELGGREVGSNWKRTLGASWVAGMRFLIWVLAAFIFVKIIELHIYDLCTFLCTCHSVVKIF